MMISAGRNKRCLLAPALHQLEPEYAAVKFERPFQIGDLQVHVTDVHSSIERAEIFAGCEHDPPSPPPSPEQGRGSRNAQQLNVQTPQSCRSAAIYKPG